MQARNLQKNVNTNNNNNSLFPKGFYYSII